MNQITEPIINQIETMVSTIHGWSPVDQLYSLFLLVYSNSHLDGNIIEIGSWCGRSSSVFGLAAQLTGIKKVICIDLFPNKSDWIQNLDGTYSFRINYKDENYSAYIDQTVWQETFEQSVLPVYDTNVNLFDIFSDNMKKLNYDKIIIPIKGNSSVLKHYVDKSFKCKFAFIDGDHGYEAVCNDIENIDPYLVSGAWICFDDAFSTYDGVNKAIQEFIIDNTSYNNCQQLTRKLFVARKI
jgi:predicted O-methyltransferase YrrM